MKRLSHIADTFEWYLNLSVSSVLQRKAGKWGDAVSPLRRMLVSLFSTMLEYQVRSVTSSRHYHITSLLFRPNEFSDLLSQLKNEESYFDGKAELSMQTKLLRFHEMKFATSRRP